MTTRTYRLTVVGCALAWLLIGLHVPALHGMIEHGTAPQPAVLVAVAILGVAGVLRVWALLREPNGRSTT